MASLELNITSKCSDFRGLDILSKMVKHHKVLESFNDLFHYLQERQDMEKKRRLLHARNLSCRGFFLFFFSRDKYERFLITQNLQSSSL